MWQVVASAQQSVAPSTTEHSFEPLPRRVSRKKGRDGASFGRVLEASGGQRLPIRTFIVRD
jgi:hypothetical protein